MRPLGFFLVNHLGSFFFVFLEPRNHLCLCNKLFFLGGVPLSRLRMNLVNLNKQSRLFSHGMIPVCSQSNCSTVPPHLCQFERYNGPVTYKVSTPSTVGYILT